MLRQAFVLMLWAKVLIIAPQILYAANPAEGDLENAYEFYDNKQLDSAALYFVRARQAYTEQGKLIPSLDAGIGSLYCYYQLSRFGEMKKALAFLAPLFQNEFEGKPEYLSTFYNLKGACHEALGEYQLGLKTALLGLQLTYKTTSNPNSLATENNNVGILYYRMGDFQSAMNYFQEALILAHQNKSISNRQHYQIYNNIGTVYLKTNRFRRAMTYLSQARVFLNRNETARPQDSIDLFNNLGLVYTELAQWDSALLYLNQAEQMHTSVPQRVAKTYHNLGHTYREAGDTAKAIRYLKLALSHNLDTYHAYHPNLAKQYRMLGEIYLEAGLAERSLSYLQKSLNTLVSDFRSTDFLANPSLENVSSYPNLLRTLRDKAVALRFYAIENDSSIIYLNAALECSILASELVEKMRFQFAKLNSKEYWYDWAFTVYEQGIENARLCYQQSHHPKYLEAAFSFFEQSKAISLLRAANDQAFKRKWSIPDSLREQDRALRIKISFLQEQWHQASEKGDLALANQHLNQIDSLKTSLESLMTIFLKKYPAYFRLNYPAPQNKIGDGQAFAQRTDLAIIEYFWGEEFIYAFVIKADSYQLHRIGATKDIAPILEEVLIHLREMPDPLAFSNAALNLYSQAAQKLYQRLLDPMDIGLVEKVLLIPDGPLSYLPFECLLSSSTPANDYQSLAYLFFDYQISYSYSLNFFFYQGQNQNKLPELETCLALAPSYSDQSISDLPYALDELAALGEYWSGKFLLGKAATKANFLTEMGAYQIFHLAMHATADTTRFLNDRLIFESDSQSKIDDASMYAAEISGLPISAEMVVLSACETGVGKFKQGEGVFSLGRAFRIAGVKSVLMSLWKVEDQSTAKLMKYFYAALAEGKSKTEALQMARQSYLFEAQGLNAHPYYWSSFILTGDPRPLTSKSDSKIIFLCALLILGVSFLLFKLVRSSSSPNP